MKVTVKDCMCLESLTPGTLVSGKRNIENRVRSISVLDAVNGKEAESLKGIKEQILLTSFKHVKKEAEKENIIKVLSKKGAAALVVFNQQNSTSQISKNLACFSENIGFPLIDIPAENPSNYSNVIEEVMDKLLYGTNFKNGLINNTIYHYVIRRGSAVNSNLDIKKDSIIKLLSELEKFIYDKDERVQNAFRYYSLILIEEYIQNSGMIASKLGGFKCAKQRIEALIETATIRSVRSKFVLDSSVGQRERFMFYLIITGKSWIALLCCVLYYKLFPKKNRY